MNVIMVYDGWYFFLFIVVVVGLVGIVLKIYEYVIML